MMELRDICKHCTHGIYNPCLGGYNCDLDFRDDLNGYDIDKICLEVEKEIKDFIAKRGRGCRGL